MCCPNVERSNLSLTTTPGSGRGTTMQTAMSAWSSVLQLCCEGNVGADADAVHHDSVDQETDRYPLVVTGDELPAEISWKVHQLIDVD